MGVEIHKDVVTFVGQLMINFKKMDDKDFVFINKSLSTQEEKEFSDFLKSRRKKARQIRARKKIKTVVSKTVKR